MKLKMQQNSRLRQGFGGQAKFKIIISFFIGVGVVLPSFSFAQEELGTAAPQTVEEAKNLVMAVLAKLPEAVKRVWKEEALPFWQKMWEWAKPFIEPWWNKLLGLFNKEVEKRKPALQEEFQKEKEEMQNELWQRFKDLIKQSL